MVKRSRDGLSGAAPLAEGHGYTVEELKGIAGELRRDIVQTIFTAGSGHPGGSLSELDILVALYFRVMRHDPANPQWPDRDRFILSKGHASPGLYAVLARAGYFPKEELATFRKLNSRLQGHAHPMTPGVEMNSGSLGMGLSFALGCALAARLDHKDYLVYVLLGDGECDEGQVWEAAMAAAHHKATNLIAFVDRNRIQNDRFTDDVMSLEPLAQKWRSFGWRVLETDGHDFGAVLAAIDKARRRRTRPTVIIAHTVKGKGVSFMENNPAFHGRAPNRQEFEQAMKELA
jgi:transketolase